MTKTLISLVAVVLLGATGMAQDPQGTKPSDSEQPKNAVQRMIDDAKKRGEVVMGDLPPRGLRGHSGRRWRRDGPRT